MISSTLVLLTVVSASTASHQVVRVSPEDAGLPSEVSVAINPTRTDNILVVSLQRREPTTNFAYVSEDRGYTWVQVEGPNPEGRTQGDDAVALDSQGHAFWSYISFHGLREDKPKTAANGIFVNRSKDGGRSWEFRTPVIDHFNTVAPFEDKPYLSVDPAGGKVYLAWTRFSKYGSADRSETSHIYFSHSENSGESFAMPVRVSDAPGDALDSDGTVEGVVPAVGVNGEVYLVWSGPRGLELDTSLDGGWTFGTDRTIAPHPGGWDLDIEGLGRANGMPVTGVDHSRGPHRGTLYVNWVDTRHGDPDVFLMFSRDAGESWSEPIRVNDDPVANGAEQFFTWMAVDPLDGSVNVAFFDRRGLRGTETGVTLARSTDGGVHFDNVAITVEPFETNAEVFFGDYLGIDAFGGLVVVAFPHFESPSELALSAAIFELE